MSLEQLLAWIPPGSADVELARQIQPDRLPQHVAIIMDGNGRWAGRRHLPRVEGHRAGIQSVREVLETSARLGLRIITLYAFSVENWKRPAAEVSTLMMLLRRYLRSELSTLLENNIRFNVLGRLDGLAPEIQTELRDAERRTAANTGLLYAPDWCAGTRRNQDDSLWTPRRASRFEHIGQCLGRTAADRHLLEFSVCHEPDGAAIR